MTENELKELLKLLKKFRKQHPNVLSESWNQAWVLEIEIATMLSNNLDRNYDNNESKNT